MTMRAFNKSLIVASRAGVAEDGWSAAAPVRSRRSVQLAGMSERDLHGRISRCSWPVTGKPTAFFHC